MTESIENEWERDVSEPVETQEKGLKRFTPRTRDDVFWTELEIRRLSNLVAEAINSRRYIGTSLVAEEERQKMHVYIDAMKRKAMRVLHRAELFANSGLGAWPGIDATIADPVSLAEEYVRLVEDYLGVVSAEEDRSRKEQTHYEDNPSQEVKHANDSAANTNNPTDSCTADEKAADINEQRNKSSTDNDPEEWEVADSVAYRDALYKHESTDGKKRNQLLGQEPNEIRRRRGNEKTELSRQDEDIMAKQRPVQDELTANLVDLVGQLKESVTANKQKLDVDKKVLDATEDAVDKNVNKLAKQRFDLKTFSRSSSMSWWLIVGIAVLVVLVFLFASMLVVMPI